MHGNTFRTQGEKASTPYSVPFLYILHFSYLISYWRHPKGRKTLSCCTVPQTNSIFPPSHQYWIRLVDYSKCSALETSQESMSVFATLQKKVINWELTHIRLTWLLQNSKSMLEVDTWTTKFRMHSEEERSTKTSRENSRLPDFYKLKWKWKDGS